MTNPSGASIASVIAARGGPIDPRQAGLMVGEMPQRASGYAGAAASFSPAITAALQPGFTLFKPSTSVLDAYILEVFASLLVTTAGTAGRTSLQLQMITTDGTAGTTGASPLDVALAASACTYRAAPTANGTASGSPFARQLVLGPTAAVTSGPPILVPLFKAATLSDAIVLEGGVNAGLEGVENQEVAGVALAYTISWHVRWIEL